MDEVEYQSYLAIAPCLDAIQEQRAAGAPDSGTKKYQPGGSLTPEDQKESQARLRNPF